MTNNIAFVVLSCDNYSDLWPVFISQFEKNWPDCTLEKFFVTNHKIIPKSSLNELKIGDDISWSDGLIKALKFLRKDFTYALITLEDLPIVNRVNNIEFLDIVSDLLRVDGNYLKFIRKPKPTKKFNTRFGVIEEGSLYRPTCVYALWKIETLLDILSRTSLSNVVKTIKEDPTITTLVLECSFPSKMFNLAKASKHLTAKLLFEGLDELPQREFKLYINHLKPSYEIEVREEISLYKKNWNTTILHDGDCIYF
jgi:hypothetical protein